MVVSITLAQLQAAGFDYSNGCFPLSSLLFLLLFSEHVVFNTVPADINDRRGALSEVPWGGFPRFLSLFQMQDFCLK